jgi:hypothetical protein
MIAVALTPDMQIDKENRRGRFAANGRLLPEEAAELAAGALAAARAEELRSLIVNFKDLSLTRRLSVAECYRVGESLARAGAGLAKVAFVVRPECIESHAFVFTVATNRGLRTAAFRFESEALAWVQGAP